MSHGIGVLAAALSSALGGTAAAATRYLVGVVDPVTLAALRFGVGFLLLLPLALAARSRWPAPRDRPGVLALGLLFFGLFFSLFNLALGYTTAGRGTLAASTLPLLTMAVAAALGVERLTWRKTAGVLVALGGVASALATGLDSAPYGAWRGDLIMAAAALCMALYSVWSRPFIARSSPLAFLTVGMGAGSGCLALLAWAGGGFAALAALEPLHWVAVAYLGPVGGAATFYLWVWALGRTTPTRVAATITVNPVAAALAAAVLLDEPIGLNLLFGLLAVGLGVWLASTGR